MKTKSILISVVALTIFGIANLASAGDPTQSKWYKRTQWVDPTYKVINRVVETPVPISDPRYNTFKYSWKAGKAIAEKGRFGEKLYNRLENHKR